MPSLQFWPLPRAPRRTWWEERTAVSTSMPPFLPTAWVTSTGAPHFLDADREAQGGHAAARGAHWPWGLCSPYTVPPKLCCGQFPLPTSGLGNVILQSPFPPPEFSFHPTVRLLPLHPPSIGHPCLKSLPWLPPPVLPDPAGWRPPLSPPAPQPR